MISGNRIKRASSLISSCYGCLLGQVTIMHSPWNQIDRQLNHCFFSLNQNERRNRIVLSPVFAFYFSFSPIDFIIEVNFNHSMRTTRKFQIDSWNGEMKQKQNGKSIAMRPHSRGAHKYKRKKNVLKLLLLIDPIDVIIEFGWVLIWMKTKKKQNNWMLILDFFFAIHCGNSLSRQFCRYR